MFSAYTSYPNYGFENTDSSAGNGSTLNYSTKLDNNILMTEQKDSININANRPNSSKLNLVPLSKEYRLRILNRIQRKEPHQGLAKEGETSIVPSNISNNSSKPISHSGGPKDAPIASNEVSMPKPFNIPEAFDMSRRYKIVNDHIHNDSILKQDISAIESYHEIRGKRAQSNNKENSRVNTSGLESTSEPINTDANIKKHQNSKKLQQM